MTESLLIDQEFRQLIPPLAAEEKRMLEESILEEGVRDAIVTWNGYIVDGHNRYDIITRHNLTDFRVVTKNFADREEARIWIMKNQIGRRNIAVYLRGEYQLTVTAWEERKAQAKANVGKQERNTDGTFTPKPIFMNSQKTVVNVTKELAAKLDIGEQTASRMIQIHEKAPESVKEKCRTGEISINEAYTEVKRAEAKEKLAEQVKTIAEVKPPMGLYRTIVVDPPWDMKKIEREERPNQHEFDYPPMSIDEIKAISIPADDNCHLYLWTTQKYLPDAFSVLESWGFRYIFTMTWHKNGGFQPFGLPQYNSEFVLFGRKGNMDFLTTKAFPTCFNGERREHSRKPESFYELVNRVSPGPKLDMYNREKREGFDQYGNDINHFA